VTGCYKTVDVSLCKSFIIITNKQSVFSGPCTVPRVTMSLVSLVWSRVWIHTVRSLVPTRGSMPNVISCHW